jgi:hypothetical protein
MYHRRTSSARVLVSCSRFKPTLIIAFFYACLAPLTIWLRMRSASFYWIGNETAFCFFMLFIFPFAVSAFACVFQPFLLVEAFRIRSRRLIPMVAFVIGLCVLGQGVKNDMSSAVASATQVQRLRQPYMVRDKALMWQLNTIHRTAFADNSMTTSKQQYVSLLIQRRNPGQSDPPLSIPMVAAFEFFNFVNVGFGVLLLCYIIFLAIPVSSGNNQPTSGKIDETVTNHLTFVITALFLWIPCRVYADWHMNFGNFDWWSSYTALLVIGIGLCACCFVLGFNMVSGSLYSHFVVPVGAFVTVCGVLVAWKRPIIAAVAQNFSAWPTVSKVSVGLIFCLVLWYVADTVHQVSTVAPVVPSVDQSNVPGTTGGR